MIFTIDQAISLIPLLKGATAKEVREMSTRNIDLFLKMTNQDENKMNCQDAEEFLLSLNKLNNEKKITYEDYINAGQRARSKGAEYTKQKIDIQNGGPQVRDEIDQKYKNIGNYNATQLIEFGEFLKKNMKFISDQQYRNLQNEISNCSLKLLQTMAVTPINNNNYTFANCKTLDDVSEKYREILKARQNKEIEAQEFLKLQEEFNRCTQEMLK